MKITLKTATPRVALMFCLTLGLLVAAGARGQAKPPVSAPAAASWNTFTSAAAYSLSLPSKASSENTSQSDASGGRIAGETVHSETAGGRYIAMVLRFNPVAVRQIQALQPGGMTLRQFMMRRIAAGSPLPVGLVKSKKPLVWNGLTGEEWFFSGKDKTGTPHSGRMRVVSNQNTLLLLFAGETRVSRAVLNAQADRFFASFRLLPPPAALSSPVPTPTPPPIVPVVVPPAPPPSGTAAPAGGKN